MDYQLKVPLRHHQEKMVEQFTNNKIWLNASEQGTGKTLPTIATLNILRNAGKIFRVLVICPNNAKYVWDDEFKNSNQPWNVTVLNGLSKKRIDMLENDKTTEVFVTNYESIPALYKAFNKAWPPCVVILDEAHEIRNPRALKSKSVLSIRSEWKWALTGTPYYNNPLDIYGIFNWISPGYLGRTLTEFRNRYADIYYGAGFPKIIRFINQDHLKKMVSKYSYRFEKKDCLDLPPKIYQNIRFDLSPKEKHQYKNMFNELVVMVDDETIEASNALTKLNKLLQMTGGFVNHNEKCFEIGDSKAKALQELLDSLNNKKVIVFYSFKKELEIIKDVVKNKLGRAFNAISGEMSPIVRKEEENSFIDPEIKNSVIAISIKIGKAALNLTAAHHVIYYSNPWSLGDRLQSEDRAHRIGQDMPVTYYNLVARGTTDEYVVKKLMSKQNVIDNLTKESIKELLTSCKI